MKSPLVPIAEALNAQLQGLTFAPPVAMTYNPLDYAWAPYRLYLERFGVKKGRVLIVGMNPGPFGMVQTGIPFGEITAVRDWMGIEAPVHKPAQEHPKRPILGFDCPRSEVSGRRLWGLFQHWFGSADAFFDRAFVYNYCPLAFVEEKGANRVPGRLPKAEREPLFAACDQALAEIVAALEPTALVGVGIFAEGCAQRATKTLGLQTPVTRVLHPSPANPQANRGWAEQARPVFEQAGLRAPQGG